MRWLSLYCAKPNSVTMVPKPAKPAPTYSELLGVSRPLDSKVPYVPRAEPAMMIAVPAHIVVFALSCAADTGSVAVWQKEKADTRRREKVRSIFFMD